MTVHTKFSWMMLIVFCGMLGICILGCKKDDDGGPGPGPGPTPITDDLFPLVPFRVFEYTGFLVDTNSVETPRPGIPPGLYQATWTLLGDLLQNGSFIIKDSTTVGAPNPNPTLLQIRKDAEGSFWFRQTLGPFYRAIAARGINITYSDTLIWVLIVKPSAGVGGTWVAFDSTWTGQHHHLGTVPVRLTINGRITYPVAITDSTTSRTQHNTYLATTTRTVVIGGQTVADGTITGRFWLAKDIGPIQLNIAGDAENYGHWRVLKNKSF